MRQVVYHHSFKNQELKKIEEIDQHLGNLNDKEFEVGADIQWDSPPSPRSKRGPSINKGELLSQNPLAVLAPW